MAIREMQDIGSFIKMDTKTDYGKEFRNLMAGIYTQEELTRIQNARLSISGVGGSAGSYLIDILVRKGFEDFILAEPEDYEIRNLSRQLFANTETLGKSKLEMAVCHIRRINPNVRCVTCTKIDLNNAERSIKDATIASYQAEGFSPWLLTRYMCSKYKVPFVNVARKRKGNSRTTIATTVFDYRAMGDTFNVRQMEFEDFGIPAELTREIIEMFDSGDLRQSLLDLADKVHNEFKYNKRFLDLGGLYPEVGSIREQYPEDYFKRYSDPEICLVAGSLASRAITDLVIGRKTRVFELDIFSRKADSGEP